MRTSSGSPPLLGPERRFAALQAIEVRKADDAGAGAIGLKGHAAVFGKRTYIGMKPWGFWESVRSGAFAKTIAEGDVRFLHNHNPDLILARTAAGTLRLTEDKTGLATDADLARTSYGEDLAVSLERGDVTQMSFSFLPVKEEWSVDDETGEETRELLEVKLFDVSTVTFPAYTETDAALRAVGMNLLMESFELDERSRARLVESIRTGVVTPDLAPVIRAAAKALGELAQKFEPASATRAQDDPLAAKSEHIRRHMQALGKLSADWTRGVNTP